MIIGDTVTFNYDTFICVTKRRMVRIDNQIHGVIVKEYEKPIVENLYESLDFSVYVSKWDIYIDCWRYILSKVVI